MVERRNATKHRQSLVRHSLVSVRASTTSSSLAKVPIRFTLLPLGGFRQVFKHSANLRLTSFASYMLVLGSLVMYHFVCICQRGTGRAYDEVLIIYKPYSTLIFDANSVSRKLTWLAKMLLHTTYLLQKFRSLPQWHRGS